MKIIQNTVVTLSYELSINDGDEEEGFDTLEAVGEDEPMVFLHGMSGLPERFEENLLNLSVGDHFDFVISPEEGYGEFDEDAVTDMPLDIFKDEKGEIPEGILEEGNLVPFTNEEGDHSTGRIVEIDGSVVVVDFNHPLAGRTMHFTGKILSIRAATAQELEHGHVHGEGGVHH